MSNRDLPVSSSLADVLRAACAKVSPVWPLERFVAVNPYFGMRDQDFETVAQTLADVAGVRSTMPRDFYARALEEGRMRAEEVEAAAEAAGLDADALLASLDAADGSPGPRGPPPPGGPTSPGPASGWTWDRS